MYMNSDATCAGNNAASFLQHAVTLGIYCGLSTNATYIYADLVLDCGNYLHSFDKVSKMYGIGDERYMCSTSATFPSNSSSATLVIPNVSIVTDDTWLRLSDDECFIYNTNSPPSLPTTPVSTPFTNSAKSLVPVLMAPIDTAPSVPIQAAPIAPTAADGIPIGVVVGGIIGGLVVICLVIIIFIISHRNSTVTITGHKPDITNAYPICPTRASDDQDPSSAPNTTHNSTSNEASNSNGVDHHLSPIQYISSASGASTIPSDSRNPPLVSSSVPNTSLGVPILATPLSTAYTVDYKDQSRSVIGLSQQHITVTGTPVEIDIPIVMAVEHNTNSVSGESNPARSGPPGRHLIDL
jgi:hypothetical protein